MSKQGRARPNTVKELIVNALGAHEGGAGNDELSDGLTLQKNNPDLFPKTHILSEKTNKLSVGFSPQGTAQVPGGDLPSPISPYITSAQKPEALVHAMKVK